MPFLSETKERIQSTTDTKKITQSLQLVAASKMKTFARKALASRRYAKSLLDTLDMTVRSAESILPYTETRAPELPHLIVLITSDKGLCGNLNQRLIKFLFAKELWEERSSPPLIVTIGKKGYEAVRRLHGEPLLNFPALGEDLKPLDSLKVIDAVIAFWTKGEVGKISLVSPHYVNPFTNHPTLKTYLPLTPDMVESHRVWHDSKTTETVFVAPPLLEPERTRVAEALTLQIVQTLFTQAFFELKAAEYSSRMVAMNKATEAASEMISDLTLEYNKARQNQITQQLAELASASEAMEEEEAPPSSHVLTNANNNNE